MMDTYGRQTRREQRLDPNPTGSSASLKRTILEFAFLAFALAPLFRFGNRAFLGTFSTVFAAIVLEALPFMLIGSVVSGLLGEFASQARILKVLSKGGSGAPFIAAALGLLFPVCECAIVPIVRKLMQKGVPPAVALAFMLGGPIVNPIVFGSTAVAYGLSWDFAFLRLVFGYCTAVFASFVFAFAFRKRQVLLLPPSPFPIYESGPQRRSGTFASCVGRTRSALVHGAEDFLDMFPFLVMGAFMTAMVQSTLDRSFFVSLAANPGVAIVLMMLLAVILSICSEADAFVAASFQVSLPLSAQMGFMVLGPMLDLKLIFMYLGVFRKRAILLVAGTTLVAVFGLMLLFDAYVRWVSIVREIGYSTRRWWAAGAYMVWASALLWLLLTERYQAFLRPGFWALLLWALAVLLLFAAALFWARPSLPAGSMAAVPGIRPLVMLLPLIYVMAAQEQTLGSHAFKNRLSGPVYMEQFTAGSRAIVEGDNPLVTLLDILQNFKAYEGRKITTLGMVYRDEVVPPAHFLVFRFLIVCCAADAMPAGALVSHEKVDSFEQDTWVSVEGTLGLKDVGDLTFPLIRADRITKIDPPKDPYLFPPLFQR